MSQRTGQEITEERIRTEILRLTSREEFIDYAENIAHVLNSPRSGIDGLGGLNAMAKFGKFVYRIDIPALLGALAAGLQPFLAPTLGFLPIGLGVIVTLAALDRAFHKLGIDEASLCQILNDKRDDFEGSVPESVLIEEFVEINRNTEDAKDRAKKAISKLADSDVVEISEGEFERKVSFAQIVLLGRRA